MCRAQHVALMLRSKASGPSKEQHPMSYDSGVDVKADRAQQPTLRIEVEVIRYGARGPIFRVTHAGKVLLARSHCPLFETCRALLDKGITGRLELWRPGKSSFDAAVDIRIGAQWTITETEKISIRLARWASWWDAVSRVDVEARTRTDGSEVLPPTPEDQMPEFDEALGK
jgi:hypothetical protein